MTTQLSTEAFCEKYRVIVRGCLEAWCKRFPATFQHSSQLDSEGMLTLVRLAGLQATVEMEEGYIATAIRNAFHDYIRDNANIFGITRGVKCQHGNGMVNSVGINEEILIDEDFFANIDNRDEILNGCCQNEEQQDVMRLKLDEFSTDEVSEKLNITRCRAYRLKSAVCDTYDRRVERDII